jgi:hypothetical protein
METGQQKNIKKNTFETMYLQTCRIIKNVFISYTHHTEYKTCLKILQVRAYISYEDLVEGCVTYLAVVS